MHFRDHPPATPKLPSPNLPDTNLPSLARNVKSFARKASCFASNPQTLEKGVTTSPLATPQFGQDPAPFRLRKTPISGSVFVVQLVTIATESKASGNSLGLQFFLIDFENVQPTDIGSLVPGSCKIMTFLGQNQSKVPVALSRILQPFGADVEYLQISGSGPNAVDFHIAFYIGRLAASHPDARFTIVSRDTGFDPLVKHLASLKIVCNRTASIGGSVKLPSPKVTSVAKGTAVKSAVAAKPKLAKNVVVTIEPGTTAGAVKSKPAAAHVTEVVKRLKGLKAAKPATLKTLQSSLKSWFKPALKPDEVVSVIAALKDSKKISVNGTKVIYALG